MKITTKLYRPKDLLAVILALEKIMDGRKVLEAKDIVIDLRKLGYKIVKVDDGG